MDVRDVVSGVGLGLAAAALTAFGISAAVRKRPGWRPAACSRFSLAAGCAALAASFLLSAHGRLSALLLAPAAAGMILSTVLEHARRRRPRDRD